MKIEKKEINKRTLVIGGIALAVVLIAAIMIAEGVSGMKKKKTDVSEGLKIIEQEMCIRDRGKKIGVIFAGQNYRTDIVRSVVWIIDEARKSVTG